MSEQLIGVVPPTICAPREYIKPSEIFETGCRVSLDWQGMAGSAAFWEVGAVIAGAERNRAQELVGLMASTGEQLAVALAAHNEVTAWRTYRLQADTDPADEMSMRGMVETQAYFVLAASHSLVNTTLRALAFAPELRTQLKRVYPPFSAVREDWASMNPGLSERLGRLADQDSRTEIGSLVEPVKRLSESKELAELLALRNANFHQWRPQSHGIQGVPHISLWKRQDKSMQISIGSDDQSSSGSTAELEAVLVNEAMIKLIDEMRNLKTTMPRAIGAIGGPRFK